MHKRFYNRETINGYKDFTIGSIQEKGGMKDICSITQYYEVFVSLV